MKLTKAEKIWLTAIIIFYVAYNLPFVPPYGDAVGTIVHAATTIIPLWICVYAGLFKIFKLQPLKKLNGNKHSDPGTAQAGFGDNTHNANERIGNAGSDSSCNPQDYENIAKG